MSRFALLLTLLQLSSGLRISAIQVARTDESSEYSYGATFMNPYSSIPQEITDKYENAIQEQRARLELASGPDYEPPDMGFYDASSKKGHAKAPNNRFEAVHVEIPLEPPLIDHTPVELGQSEKSGIGGKNIVNANGLKSKGDCVVYSLGVAGNSRFEDIMASKYDCEVHAFDCTVNANLKNIKASMKNPKFNFHEWCIGDDSKVNMEASGYTKGGGRNHEQSQMVFKSLATSMKELGHTSMDLLKFDIEGFEWQLFERELLKGIVKPQQISFELHTEGAKPWAVPEGNTKGRTNNQVNNLFLQMHKHGYRVASKELNRHDHACAEFVMILA